MGLDEEIQEVKSEIKQLEAQQLELSKRKRKGIATEDELAELDHLSSVLSRRESDLHDLRKIQAPPVQVKENPPELIAFRDACHKIVPQIFPDTLIKLPDEVFILGDNSIGSSIYIRPCYPTLLKIALNIVEQVNTPHLVILGNPGIGKTFFGYLLLIHLLHQGATVVYESGTENLRFLFSPTLIAIGTLSDFFSILRNSSTFYLADAVRPVRAKAKTILLTSPRRDQWFKFSDDRCTLRYMPVWSEEEIMNCRRLLYSHVTEAEAKKLFTEWGGIPRFVLQNAHDEEQQKKLKGAIARVDLYQIKHCVGKLEAGDQITHLLVHMHVVEFKIVCYVFASKHVAHDVYEALILDNRQKLLEFLLGAKGRPECAVLRGHLFEEHAHAILTQGGTFSTRPLFKNHIAPETTLNLVPSRPFTFNKDDGIPNNLTDMYYKPASPNFPVIDSFIKPNLLFQMTISLKHKYKEEELEKVLKLIGCSDDPQFYFVVPDEIFKDFAHQTTTPSKKHKDFPSIQQHVLKIDITSEVKRLFSNTSES